MLFQHESGNNVFFAADKSVTITGQNGSKTVHDPNGRRRFRCARSSVALTR